jgi:hypothetical protein
MLISLPWVPLSEETTEEANLTREDRAPHQLVASAWYFTALDDATEAQLSAIVRTAAI